MIKIKNVSKSFGDFQVLKNINIEIKKGEIYGLVGLSGAGKSTLLRCINGLHTIDIGEIKVGNKNIHELDDKELSIARQDIGMVFQDFLLISRMNVFENISLPMKNWGYSKEKCESRVVELLKLVGLEDKIYDKPYNLSGGEQQRVAIARAIAMEPSVLLCDEPTSALDPNTGKEILNLLVDMNTTLGVTIVLVSHQMEAVKQICDSISILDKGEVVSQGKVEDLFFELPNNLIKLLGEAPYGKLDKNKKYLKIKFNTTNTQAEILSKLSLDLGVKYRYIEGGTEKFKDSESSISLLQIPSDIDFNELEQFLLANKVRCEII